MVAQAQIGAMMAGPFASRRSHFAGLCVMIGGLTALAAIAQNSPSTPSLAPVPTIAGPAGSPAVVPLPASPDGLALAAGGAARVTVAAGSAKAQAVVAKRIEPMVLPVRRGPSPVTAPRAVTAPVPAVSPKAAATVASGPTNRVAAVARKMPALARRAVAAAKPALPGRQSLGALIPSCKAGLRLNATGNKCEPIPRTAAPKKPAAQKSAASQPSKR